MKIVELECQNCGAALKVEEGNDIYTCPYCKATYKLDKENMEDSGYEFEKGRIKAQREHMEKTFGSSKVPLVILVIPVVMFIIIASSIWFFTDHSSKITNDVSTESSEDREARLKKEEEEKAKLEEEERIRKEEQAKRELEYRKDVFNMSFHNGEQASIFVKSMLDKVITTNKTENDKKITVKYNDIETQDENKIVEIEKSLTQYGKYYISFEYDDEGFINTMIIK